MPEMDRSPRVDIKIPGRKLGRDLRRDARREILPPCGDPDEASGALNTYIFHPNYSHRSIATFKSGRGLVLYYCAYPTPFSDQERCRLRFAKAVPDRS